MTNKTSNRISLLLLVLTIINAGVLLYLITYCKEKELFTLSFVMGNVINLLFLAFSNIILVFFNKIHLV